MVAIVVLISFAILAITPLIISKCIRDQEVNKKWMNV